MARGGRPPATKQRSRCSALLFSPPIMTASPATTGLTALKVCGVVSPFDARLIAHVAKPLLPPQVDLLIGMILWPGSSRSVSASDAAAIAAAAHANGATPVAVFVDEDVPAIEAACTAADIPVAQLHGRRSRHLFRSAASRFHSGLRWIDVRDVAQDGTLVEEPKTGPDPFWTLYDAKGGGTGQPFDWNAFPRPTEPWLLAGGLDPDNVVAAVTALRPDGVDVASGVAKGDRCHKDEARLESFVQRLVKAYS